MTLAARLAPLVLALVFLWPAPTVTAQDEDSIDDYFNGCKDDWLRPRGSLGTYTLVACDQRILTRYFKNGLEEDGPEDIRIHDSRRPAPDVLDPGYYDESPPAVFETGSKAQWTRAIITNRAFAKPYVYAAVQLIDGSVIEARFAPVRMPARSRWTLRPAARVWRLIERDGDTVARARRRHIDIPPLSKPFVLVATRKAATLRVTWISNKQRIGTRFRVLGAAGRGAPWRLLATLGANGGGEEVTRRFRGKRWASLVRVEAQRAGRAKASSAYPVTRRD